MRPAIIILLSILVISCTQTPTDQGPNFPEGEWIDLSYAFDEETVFWPTAESFRLDTVFAGTTEGGYYYSAFQFCLAEHGGTHLDSPVHFSEGKWTVDEIPVDRLMGPAIVVDVSERALKDRDYQFTVDDITIWEETNGPLPEDAIVLFRTGYGQYWPDREAYMGTAERGPEAVAKLHFPGISPELALFLVEKRKIKAVGLDTPSLDDGQSTAFESHQILNGQNILGFENLANLEQLPEAGAWLIALPMKIKGGSGAPLRVLALLPD